MAGFRSDSRNETPGRKPEAVKQTALIRAFRARFCVPVVARQTTAAYFDLSAHNEEIKPKPRFGTKPYQTKVRTVLHGFRVAPGTSRAEVKQWLQSWLNANGCTTSLRQTTNALLQMHA